MNDASGHYSNGFLYGNNYWTGSYRLCDGIYVEEGSVKTDTTSKQSEITSINGYNEKTAVKHENPPFVPTFYIVKLRLNDTEISPTVSGSVWSLVYFIISNLQFQPRIISVAACLPYDCSQEDVSIIANNAEVSSTTRDLSLIEVKIGLKEPYDFWNDFVFQLVL